MSAKGLLRIVVVLAIALAAWALLALLRRSSTDTPLVFVLPHLSADSTESIDYVGPQDTVRLARRGSAWTVNGHPAAPRVVDAFFRALGDTSTRSELVAESVESHQRLGVDSTAAKRLTVAGGGKTLLDLWFGSRGPDFEGFYVRRVGDNRVFLLRGTFADLTVQPLEDWREKQVLTLATDSLTRIDVVRGKGGYSLTRSGSEWTISRGAAVDSVVMRHYLARLKEVRATGFPSPAQADSARFAPAERRVTLFGSGGAPIASLSFDSLASTFVLRVGDGTDLYTMEQRMTELVAPAESTFRK
jgi:Domain of unknown function (DUF4340)